MSQAAAIINSATHKRRITGAFWLVFWLLALASFQHTGFFDFARMGQGLSKLSGVLGFMLPPASHGDFWKFCGAILQTLSMAFLGTLGASILALPLGFLGAKNIIPQRVFHFFVRRGFDTLRGADQLIWALIFINVVGMGPFAGILAIIASDTGVLGKLFAEAIENVNRKQVDGVRATGANVLQVIRFGVLPQVLPVMLSNSLYYFESNTRSATILGIVGAGGIGLELSDRIRINNWDEAAFIICMILVTVTLIDTLSTMIRKRFINNGEQ